MKNSTLLKYAVASNGDSMLYCYVTAFWLYYMTTVSGIPPAVAGTIAATGAVFQAIAGPFFAAWSDRFEHKLGKRRPFIILASAPLGLCACLMFSELPLHGSLRIAVMFCLGAGFWVLFAAFFIPHLAWGAEIATGYDERTTIRTYSYVMYTTGFLIGSALPTFAVERLEASGFGAGGAWLCVTIILAGISAGCILYTGLSIREQPSKRESELSPFSLKVLAHDYGQVLKLRPLRLLIFAVIAYLIGNSMMIADRMYAFTFQMGFSGSFISVLMLVFGLLGIVLAAPMMKFAKRFDKRTALIACLSVCGCIMALLRFADIANAHIAFILLLMLVYVVISTAYYQLMPATFYDICEVDEYENKIKRAGTITSTMPMAQSLASAVGMQLLGVRLQIGGFESGAAVQSSGAIAAIYDCFTLAPGVMFVIAAFFLYRFPITKQRFETIRAELAARRGEQTPPSV
ncbi:MAG: MFS transporter [Clostridiales Family XIII bacterium]|jgi:GPH family glycoside/pentoside/hexuronide:cation symporter|nr:MFS transporter [Clostridiales Family XIII bacterium]